jgi:hypothetical protein
MSHLMLQVIIYWQVTFIVEYQIVNIMFPHYLFLIYPFLDVQFNVFTKATTRKNIDRINFNLFLSESSKTYMDGLSLQHGPIPA